MADVYDTWRLEPTATGNRLASFDKADSSANILSAEVMSESALSSTSSARRSRAGS